MAIINPNLTADQVAAYQAEAAKLDAILSRGASEVQTDGVKVSYDLALCRTRLRDLNRLLYPGNRPRAMTQYLGGF